MKPAAGLADCGRGGGKESNRGAIGGGSILAGSTAARPSASKKATVFVPLGVRDANVGGSCADCTTGMSPAINRMPGLGLPRGCGRRWVYLTLTPNISSARNCDRLVSSDIETSFCGAPSCASTRTTSKRACTTASFWSPSVRPSADPLASASAPSIRRTAASVASPLLGLSVPVLWTRFDAAVYAIVVRSSAMMSGPNTPGSARRADTRQLLPEVEAPGCARAVRGVGGGRGVRGDCTSSMLVTRRSRRRKRRARPWFVTRSACALLGIRVDSGITGSPVPARTLPDAPAAWSQTTTGNVDQITKKLLVLLK